MRLLALTLGALLAGGLYTPALANPAPAPFYHRGGFNTRGDFLISDQFNNRVIEADETGKIVWQYGRGPNDVSAASPVGVNDAQRVGDLTLISGTGAPAGTEPDCPMGCADNRVFLVNREGRHDAGGSWRCRLHRPRWESHCVQSGQWERAWINRSPRGHSLGVSAGGRKEALYHRQRGACLRVCGAYQVISRLILLSAL